jgi:hypothetical protein
MERVYYEVKSYTHTPESKRETSMGALVRGNKREDVVKYGGKRVSQTDRQTGIPVLIEQ